MIACDGLTRYYGSFRAVDALSFTIERGAVCALVGPNGAGKSTTMRMLSTLLRPSRGHATVGGCDVVKDREGVRRQIGYLPETFQLYDDMTVERYLHFFARAYGLDANLAQERIADYLERLGLLPKRADKVGALSRGMRQRLGVAKSFLHDPDVVFLDEPASGLDPVARTELRDFLKFQQRLGKTVVVSSHVLKELADFCDHIAIMQDGRLVEYGPLSGEQGVLARYGEAGRGGKSYVLKLLKDAPRAEIAMKDVPGLSSLKRLDVTLTFELAGGEEAAAALLGRLVGQGFQVTRFAEEEVDLEHVYRKASGGRGEV